MVLQKFLVQDVVLAAVACDGLVLGFLDGLLGGIAWTATGTKLPIHCVKKRLLLYSPPLRKLEKNYTLRRRWKPFTKY